MTAPLVIIGESNPHGDDPRFALHDAPANCAGDRLRRIVFGVRRTTYHRVTRRLNLCSEDPWSATNARGAAWDIEVENPNGVLVLLGQKVARAFLQGPEAWTRAEPFVLYGTPSVTAPHGRYLVLPHPSGRSTAWNDPTAVPRARALLVQIRPDIPWGELDRLEVPSTADDDLSYEDLNAGQPNHGPAIRAALLPSSELDR